MTEKLTQNDAQQAIQEHPFFKEFDERMPVSELAQKVVDLINAKEVKVFCTRKGEIVKSEPMDALDVQKDMVKWAAGIKGITPKTGVKFEGTNGENITFELYLGGKEEKDAKT